MSDKGGAEGVRFHWTSANIVGNDNRRLIVKTANLADKPRKVQDTKRCEKGSDGPRGNITRVDNRRGTGLLEGSILCA